MLLKLHPLDSWSNHMADRELGWSLSPIPLAIISVVSDGKTLWNTVLPLPWRKNLANFIRCLNLFLSTVKSSTTAKLPQSSHKLEASPRWYSSFDCIWTHRHHSRYDCMISSSAKDHIGISAVRIEMNVTLSYPSQLQYFHAQRQSIRTAKTPAQVSKLKQKVRSASEDSVWWDTFRSRSCPLSLPQFSSSRSFHMSYIYLAIMSRK